LLTFLTFAAPAQASDTATHIVQLRGGVSPSEGGAIVRAAGGRVTATLPIINGVAARLSPNAQHRLAGDGRIARVSVNARTFSTRILSVRPPRDPDSSRLETAYPFSVLAPQSWPTATGEGVGVAVIDTGIDGDLPDFADSNGESRVVTAVVTNPDAQTATDTYGHGTHVAGIIAGDGGRRDFADPAWAKYIGIAPRANLIAIKASDDEGRGTILDAIYGLQFAVDHKDEFNIRVVNLSLSSTVAESYKTDPLDAAVE
jgi:serine protease AprX